MKLLSCSLWLATYCLNWPECQRNRRWQMRCQFLKQTPREPGEGRHRVVSLTSTLGKLENAVVQNELVVMDVQWEEMLQTFI